MLCFIYLLSWITLNCSFTFWSVCYVQVLGRPLSPVLDLIVHESADSLAVTYFPDARNDTLPASTAEEDARDLSSWQSLATRFRHLGAIRWSQVILSTLGPFQFSDEDGDVDSDNNDDDYGDMEEEQDLCRTWSGLAMSADSLYRYHTLNVLEFSCGSYAYMWWS